MLLCFGNGLLWYQLALTRALSSCIARWQEWILKSRTEKRFVQLTSSTHMLTLPTAFLRVWWSDAFYSLLFLSRNLFLTKICKVLQLHKYNCCCKPESRDLLDRRWLTFSKQALRSGKGCEGEKGLENENTHTGLQQKRYFIKEKVIWHSISIG